MPEQAIEVLDAGERTASRVETVGEAADPSFERRAALTAPQSRSSRSSRTAHDRPKRAARSRRPRAQRGYLFTGATAGSGRVGSRCRLDALFAAAHRRLV
jgi:hypothetical protein